MKLNLVLLLLSTLVFASCKKDKDLEKIYPSASFNFTLSQDHAPATVYFENLSLNATSYNWDFGNGRTSSLFEPQITYNNPGTYNITLTAYNRDGKDTFSQAVEVIYKPSPTSLRIDGLQITSMSLAGWDTLSGPDVYFKMWLGNNMVIDNTDDRVTDVTESLMNQLDWTCSQELAIGSPVTVCIYDYDESDSDDLISTMYFSFNNYTSYPLVLTKTENGLTINLYVTWFF